MITAWRIVHPMYADDAFSGEGPRRRGGRWNPPKTAVVYTASSVALATLELLVHNPRALLLPEYVLFSCSFPEAIVESVDRKRLPAKWRDYPPPVELQGIGNEWLQSRASAVLEVPSAVVEEEVNYLLNPEHDDFRSVDIGGPRPFHVDLRLLT
ncbi:MAG TPA: RES family NAD+ phosphorylase [Thermoanaerobaculia bacterium]|nr:RES family NAD+ phosphorylase [Thermoanaerobaculia bacterium]